MLEQTTLEVIAVNDHRKCYRCDHTTVIVIMPIDDAAAKLDILFKENKKSG